MLSISIRKCFKHKFLIRTHCQLYTAMLCLIRVVSPLYSEYNPDLSTSLFIQFPLPSGARLNSGRIPVVFEYNQKQTDDLLISQQIYIRSARFPRFGVSFVVTGQSCLIIGHVFHTGCKMQVYGVMTRGLC